MHQLLEKMENEDWHGRLGVISSFPQLLEVSLEEPPFKEVLEESRRNPEILQECWARFLFFCHEKFDVTYANPYDWQLFLYMRVLMIRATEVRGGIIIINGIVENFKKTTNTFWPSIYLQSVLAKQYKP